ncbi:MAG: HdeD family acid-resistance protein [Methylohalobius sp. ZOD2]
MKLREKYSRFDRYHSEWWRVLMQGGFIALTGIVLALASAFRPDSVILLAYGFSWLPLGGMVILAMGLLECLDAYFAHHQRDFLQNLQVGVLDTVVGGMIVFNVTPEPAQLSLLIAAFLIVRGIVRTVLAYALRLPQTVSTAIGGVVSIILGILVWSKWTSAEGWLLALCLSLEIAFRGWAMMMFALWVRTHRQELPDRVAGAD